jgi:Sulfatase-modifying factor enzyme 1
MDVGAVRTPMIRRSQIMQTITTIGSISRSQFFKFMASMRMAKSFFVLTSSAGIVLAFLQKLPACLVGSIRGAAGAPARQYAAWIAQFTGKPYRMLTEAEWEYAARAGTTTAYSWGNDIGTGNANCNGCGSQWDAKPAPVGSFKPNEFGLYDMHGNVFEWCEDFWHDNYNGAPTDGSAWLQSEADRRRVIRGGSWYDIPQGLRAASRDWYFSISVNQNLGFRLARTLNP